MDSQIFALLSDRGSLTERFKQLMGVKPKLTRLRQEREFVSLQERELLGIEPRQMALIREIKMAKGDQDWLFARTIVPLATLNGSARRIGCLNETPIGKILFGRQPAKRRSMQVALTLNYPQSAIGYDLIPAEKRDLKLWLRRSIFEFEAGPLMVSELFLPNCPIYETQE